MRITSAILTAAIAAAFFTSCKNSPYDGYDTSESGVYYKFYEQNEDGKKPVEGDFVSVRMIYKNDKDSVLFNSKDFTKNPDGTLDFPLTKSTFKGSFEDALAMMGEGDSASFKISADSVYLKTFGAKELPPYVAPGSMLTFETKLVKIKSKEEVEKEMQAEQQKQMEEMQKMMEQRKGAEGGEIEDYLTKNKITLKPTESGLYYIEQKKGTGARVKEGDNVTVAYTLYLLDGTKMEENTATFGLNQGAMIPGFIEGLTKMNVGGKATLLMPSALAYGEMGSRSIPPYTPLLFEVEIKDTKPGTGGDAPGQTE